MGKTLLSEVFVGIESNLDSASGDLIHEGRRVQQLYEDLGEARPMIEEASAGTRETTIHGLYFSGFFGRMMEEMTGASGMMAAFISLTTGLTGTVLDQIIFAVIDAFGKVAASLGRAKDELEEGGLADYIYRHSHDDGWKGWAWQTVEDLLFPILGPEPPEYGILDEESAEANVPEFGNLEGSLMDTINSIQGVREEIASDPNLSRLIDTTAKVKELEDMLTKDAAKNMANFWVNAITQTEGWKKLTGAT